MSRLGRVYACCVSGGIPGRSLGVAFVVGTILNLINQGDALVGRGDLSFTEIVFTYAVLYCVAIYGAVSYRFGAAQAEGIRASPASRSPSPDAHDK